MKSLEGGRFCVSVMLLMNVILFILLALGGKEWKETDEKPLGWFSSPDSPLT